MLRFDRSPVHLPVTILSPNSLRINVDSNIRAHPSPWKHGTKGKRLQNCLRSTQFDTLSTLLTRSLRIRIVVIHLINRIRIARTNYRSKAWSHYCICRRIRSVKEKKLELMIKVNDGIFS